MAGKNSRNIQYTAQEEPSFIKRFKEKIGYKNDPGIEAKQQHPENSWSDEEESERDQIDDEKPVVVVLGPGDLTAEEAEAHTALEGHQKPGDEGDSLGRIVFRKPTKRESSDNEIPGLSSSTAGGKKAKKAESHDKSEKESSQSKDSHSSTSSKKRVDANLLSFDDEDV